MFLKVKGQTIEDRTGKGHLWRQYNIRVFKIKTFINYFKTHINFFNNHINVSLPFLFGVHDETEVFYVILQTSNVSLISPIWYFLPSSHESSDPASLQSLRHENSQKIRTLPFLVTPGFLRKVERVAQLEKTREKSSCNGISPIQQFFSFFINSFFWQCSKFSWGRSRTMSLPQLTPPHWSRADEMKADIVQFEAWNN